MLAQGGQITNPFIPLRPLRPSCEKFCSLCPLCPCGEFCSVRRFLSGLVMVATDGVNLPAPLSPWPQVASRNAKWFRRSPAALPIPLSAVATADFLSLLPLPVYRCYTRRTPLPARQRRLRKSVGRSPRATTRKTESRPPPPE